jgi:hypothetical protein
MDKSTTLYERFPVDDLDLMPLTELPREDSDDPHREGVRISTLIYTNTDGQEFEVRVAARNLEAAEHYIQTAKLRARAFPQESGADSLEDNDERGERPALDWLEDALLGAVSDLGERVLTAARRGGDVAEEQLARLSQKIEGNKGTVSPQVREKLADWIRDLFDDLPKLPRVDFDDADADAAEPLDFETLETEIDWRGEEGQEYVLRMTIDPQVDTIPGNTVPRVIRHVMKKVQGTTATVTQDTGDIALSLQRRFMILRRWIWLSVASAPAPSSGSNQLTVSHSTTKNGRYRLHISAEGDHATSTFTFDATGWTPGVGIDF